MTNHYADDLKRLGQRPGELYVFEASIPTTASQPHFSMSGKAITLVSGAVGWVGGEIQGRGIGVCAGGDIEGRLRLC